MPDITNLEISLPNNWEAVGVIGRGSSGTVYRAKRVIGRNTEWAAVKHISMPANQDDLDMIRSELGTANEDTINSYLYESLQDMLGEYFQMKSLQGNTNIVACHDIQQIPKADGVGYDVFIWMELLNSLSNLIINGKMDRNETIRMGMDICHALSLLRSKGIVHRDIKPQNIFVNENGDYKLGDFGSARGIKGTSTILSMRGTYSYMAPEIMQGRPANYTSDIYSLGLVMYRLMNRNRHPFIEEGDISSAREIEESNYRRLGGEALPMPVDADEELGHIILKACAFEPRNRWQTPEEMYNALAALGEETIKKVSSFGRSPVFAFPEKEAKADSFETASISQKPMSAFTAPEKTEAATEKAAQRMDQKSTEQVEETRAAASKAEQSGIFETVSFADRNKVKSDKSKQDPSGKRSRLLGLLLLGAVIVIGVLFGIIKNKCLPSDLSDTDNIQANEAETTPTPSNQIAFTTTLLTGSEYGDFGNVLVDMLAVKADGSIQIQPSMITYSSLNAFDLGFQGSGYKFNLAFIKSNDLARLYGEGASYEDPLPDCYALAPLFREPIMIISNDPIIQTVSDIKNTSALIYTNYSGQFSLETEDVLDACGISIQEDNELIAISAKEAEQVFHNHESVVYFTCGGISDAEIKKLLSIESVHLVPVDEEIVQSITNRCLFYEPYTISSDTYDTEADCHTLAVQVVLVSDTNVGNDVAYTIAKTIFENIDEIASVGAKSTGRDIFYSTSGIDILFHPGAAEYYEQQGIKVKTVQEIKIGVILDYDENTTETLMHIEGIKTATKNLGLSEPEWRYRVEETAAQQTAEDLVAQGCNVIIASGFGFERPLVQAAREDPEVLFIIYDGETANVCGLDNLVNVFPKIYESRYVSGVVAGLKLKELIDEGKITDPYLGYVETKGLPTMVSSYTAFFLGVRSIVPKAHMDVKYTYSWYDPYASSEAAQSLMDKGCVIICQGYPLDTGVPSAVQSAVESGQLRYCIGYGIDWLAIAPDAALTSAQANMSAHYQAILSKLLSGRTVAHDYALGYGEDGVMISALGGSCAPGTAEKVEEVIAAIKDGSIHVFDTSTFTVNGKTVQSDIFDLSVMNSDYTAVEYVGEKLETVFDGYFHESYFRSSPYFNLRIDGVTEIY